MERIGEPGHRAPARSSHRGWLRSPAEDPVGERRKRAVSSTTSARSPSSIASSLGMRKRTLAMPSLELGQATLEIRALQRAAEEHAYRSERIVRLCGCDLLSQPLLDRWWWSCNLPLRLSPRCRGTPRRLLCLSTILMGESHDGGTVLTRNTDHGEALTVQRFGAPPLHSGSWPETCRRRAARRRSSSPRSSSSQRITTGLRGP